jgi:hypothetical protein
MLSNSIKKEIFPPTHLISDRSKSFCLSKKFTNIVFILPFSLRPEDKEANRRNGELNISFETTKTIEEEG